MNYRDNVYDTGEEMLRRLGTFWYYIFQDQDKVAQFQKGSFLEAGQTYLNFLESMATISRFETPIFHQENWFYLTFLESDLTASVAKYGEGLTYGDAHLYGVKAARSNFSITLRPGLVAGQFMFNRIIQPSLTYTSGVDFQINTEANILTFRENPFENALVAKRNVVDTQGNVVDREAVMWIYNGQFDLEYVWIHWGYALKAFMNSSYHYRDFINALADSYVLCPSVRSTQQLISALTGVPLVIEPVEVVEVILTVSNRVQVVTDYHVYTFEPNAVVTVSVGETVHGGDSLTDAVRVIELIDHLPTALELPGISVGSNWLTGVYLSELLFENRTVPLQYLGIVDGKVKVEFEVSGFDEDVTKFWDDTHARGVAQGKVLADYMDLRTVKDTPPLPENLPATVNPLQFMLGNLMRNNVFLIVLKPDQFPSKSPGISLFSYLRRALPPHTTYLVYVEINAGTEYIDYSDSQLLTEDEQFFDVPDGVVLDLIDPSFVEEFVTARLVKEC